MKLKGHRNRDGGPSKCLPNYLPWTASERGAALILTLIFVALLTGMVIAFYATMRVEQRASHAYANTQRAKMVSQGAVSHGIELLRANIPEPALISESAEVAAGELWVTNPGRLTVVREDGSETIVPLHTGAADQSPNETDDPDVYSVDLNEPLPGRKDPPIATAMDANGRPNLDIDAPPMRVKWVPVLERPAETASEENQISGRYAFWMDDESSKINFNVALGKPSRRDEDPQGFWQQYDMGMMTPLFTSGVGDVEFNENSKDREWALGRPRSVNLDVLFDDASLLDTDALLAHAWLRGFARYPESILQFVDLPDNQKREWFTGNRYNLTFYSRSPEFNVFGKPRLFTTNIPLSLEAGPMYQMPFVYNGPEVEDPDFDISGVLHLNTLMGSMGFTHGVQNEDGRRELAGNVVNRAQFEMLKRYMTRKWPGYDASFVDKYGERECYQMALSMLLMARMATTTMSNANRNTGRNNFSRDYAFRTSSTIYSPPNGERTWWRPERHYWPIKLNSNEDKSSAVESTEDADIVPMLPQHPGPYITEVLLTFQVIRDSKSGKKKVRFRYSAEYYMPDLGPEVFLKYFPAKVDYLRIEPTAVRPEGMPDFYELGPPNPDAMTRPKRRNDQDWNFQYRRMRRDANGDPILNQNGKPRYALDKLSLGNLRISPNRNIKLVSRNSTNYGMGKNKGTERKVVTSPWRYLGKFGDFLPHTRDRFENETGGNHAEDEALLIDSDTGLLKFDVKLRLGMGILNDSKRTVQMIPLGETSEPEHVLEADFELDTRFTDGPKTVSWQISDPRLSWHKESWILDTESEGTPGEPNAIGGEALEPDDDSSEKSKMRYFQRGPGQVKSMEADSPRAFPLNRPDEYNSRSRITSKGYWSVLHTGIQGNPDQNEPPTPWRTLDLGGGESNDSGPPDYLLLDLIGATYPMQHDQWRINSTLPDEFSTVSFMNSTAGQVNLNSKVYPDDSPYFMPPERSLPLEAVFKHLRTDEEVRRLVDAINDRQESEPFLYVGELAEVDGYLRNDDGATQFQNEELLRNMMGSLATNSNTFGLWGVAQVVQKIPGHSEWGEFEDGDRVLAEKRFHAVIERYIWPGNDGVPGNAHVNSSGEWDRIALQAAEIPFDGAITDTLFQLPGSPPLLKPENSKRLRLDRKGTYPVFDGPQKVEMDRFVSGALGKVLWEESSLEVAYNPPQPVIKYRVVYFRYLDE